MNNDENDKVTDVLENLRNNLEKNNIDDIYENITLLGNTINEGIIESVEAVSKTIDNFTENYEKNMSKVERISNFCINNIEELKKSVQSINTESSSRQLKNLAQFTGKSKDELKSAIKIISPTNNSYSNLKNTVNSVGNSIEQLSIKTRKSSEFINKLSNASLNCEGKVGLLGKSFNNYTSNINTLTNSLNEISGVMDNISDKAINAKENTLLLLDAFKLLDGKKVNVNFNKKEDVKEKNISSNKQQSKITNESESSTSVKNKDDDVDINKYISAVKSLSTVKVLEHFRTLKNELKDSAEYFKKAFKRTDKGKNKISFAKRATSFGNGLKGAGTALNKGISSPLFKGFKSVIDAGLKNEDKMAKSKGKNVPPGKGTVAVNSIKGALKKLDTSLTKLKISIYNAILPTLLKALPLVVKLINFLTRLVDRFNKLPVPIKSFVSNIALVSMIIGPVLITLGKLINTVSNVVKVFRLIKAAVNIFKLLPALINGPVLITIGIIGGLGLIIYEVIKHWNTIKKYTSKVWCGIKSIVKKAVGGTVKFLNTAFVGLKDKFREQGKDIIGGLIHGISSMFGKVKEVAANIAHKVAGTFKKLLGINSPSRVFIGFGQNIAEGLVDGLDRQDDIIANKVKGISSKIKSIGHVKPNLSDIAVNGRIGSNSRGMSSVNNTNNSNKVTFNPNIKMYINLSDIKEKGIKELSSQLESITMSAMKNTMTNLFMKDAIRSY